MPRLTIKPLLFLLTFTILCATVLVFLNTTQSYRSTSMIDLSSNSLQNAQVGLSTKKKKGFVVSFRFYEQQTQGLHNFLQLQCIASSMGMKIVEPFVVNSMFVIPFQEFFEESPNSFLKLGELINLQVWNSYTTSKNGYLPISSWDNFLKEAPKNVIINCVRYRHPPKIAVPKPGFNFRNGCSKSCFDKFSPSLQFLSKFGFKLVRKTCSNFIDYAGSVSLDEFQDNIFGKYDPNDVSVFLNEFRGLFGLYRLPLRSECGIKNSNMSILPSTQILKDARVYSRQAFHGKKYVSIVARIERVTLHLHRDVAKCAKEVEDILNKLKTDVGTSEVFLAMDVGKFGSRSAIVANLQPKGEQLFHTIYGTEKWTFEEWESSFVNITSSKNPAYIANLQRTIAAKGECLIMFGGGGFQGQARSLYEKFHPERSKQCVFRVCNTDSLYSNWS